MFFRKDLLHMWSLELRVPKRSVPEKMPNEAAIAMGNLNMEALPSPLAQQPCHSLTGC